MRDQAAGLRALAKTAKPEPGKMPEGKGRVLAIASGKGGVGKTNVVANLGCALSKRGLKVLALDADFGLANLDIMLNLSPQKNLTHLLKGEATAAEIINEASPGFFVIPGANGVEGLADMDSADRERIMAGLMPLAEGYDYVLIDNAAGIGKNVIELCLAAGEVVVVTDPQPTSLTDAYGLVKILDKRSPGITLRVIVNSAPSVEEGEAVWRKLEGVTKRFLDRGTELLGVIVRDEFVPKATQKQEPFVTAYPRSKAAKCVEKIIDDLTGHEQAATGGMGGFWNRLLGFGGPK